MSTRFAVLVAALAPLVTTPSASISAQQTGARDSVVALPGATSSDDAPGVQLWIDGDREMRNGQEGRVYFRTDRQAFVTVARVDADGRLSILFPRSPLEDGAVGGEQTYLISGRNGASFRTGERPGVGMIFAIASDDPFDFRPYARNNGWRHSTVDARDVELVGAVAPGRPATDIVQRVAHNLTFDDRTPYAYDVEYYTVDSTYLHGAARCYMPSGGACRASYTPGGYDPSFVPTRAPAVTPVAVAYDPAVYAFTNYQFHFLDAWDGYCSSWTWYGFFYSPCHWLRPYPTRVIVHVPGRVRVRPFTVVRWYRPWNDPWYGRRHDWPDRYARDDRRDRNDRNDRDDRRWAVPRDRGPDPSPPRRTAQLRSVQRPVDRTPPGSIGESDRIYDMPAGGLRARRPIREQPPERTAEPRVAQPRAVEPVQPSQPERRWAQTRVQPPERQAMRRESIGYGQPVGASGYGLRGGSTGDSRWGSRRAEPAPMPRAVQPTVAPRGDRGTARTYSQPAPREDRYGRRRP